VTNLPDLSDSLADRLSASMLAELREVLAQPDHPVRLRYEDWLKTFVARLRSDPELVASVRDMKERAIDDPALQAYVSSLWADVKQLLRENLAADNSTLARYAQGALQALGQRLASDDSLRDALNEHLLAAAGELAANLRVGITSHISQTVKAWDDEQLVRTLELQVGRDLQFIRINGTVVGGLIGLVLHALALLR
jgi:uncharacterized membrane-anchored protein YjiN (DUF445 family)